MKVLKLLMILALLPSFNLVSAQNYFYFVQFTDKQNTPYDLNEPQNFLSPKSIHRRTKQGIKFSLQDLPPNPWYVDSLIAAGAQVKATSKWMNAALITASESQKNQILNLPFVAGIAFNAPLKQARMAATASKFAMESLDYGDATTQISFLGVDEMHEAGFHGENMLIAVMDAGFLNANQITCLDTIFENQRVLEIFDFVDHDSTLYDAHNHGTNVLSCLGGYKVGTLIAPAFAANYLLYRTEDFFTESKLEEVNWLLAAERADSVGADIISTSLGYSVFDNPADNYNTTDMDGNTALITKAADLAAAKGMLIVNSAGNSGGSSWNIITAPADGDSVLAVGAMNRSGIVAGFSSRGPAADGAVKPDVMAVGQGVALCNTNGTTTGTANGTSFSAPLTSGMAAGFWQANPHLNSLEVLDCIRKSGHLYTSPNNDYGYGYANFHRADSAAKVHYPLLPLIPQQNLDYIQISDESPIKLKFKLNSSLVGKTIQINIFDAQNAQSIEISNAMLENEVDLNFNTLNENTFLRIENITDAQNLAIFKY